MKKLPPQVDLPALEHEVLKRWDSMRGETLAALNAQLQRAGLPPIVVKPPKEKVEREGPDDF